MCLLVAVVPLGGDLGAADLPPEIRVDRLLVQADVEAAEGNAVNALASLDSAAALLEEHDLETPEPFWYQHARVAALAGEHERAVESATRYLATVGRNGDDYNRALELLVASERAVEESRQAREAAARERRAAEKVRQEVLEQEALAYAEFRGALLAEGQGQAAVFFDELATGGEGPVMVLVPGGILGMGCDRRRDINPKGFAKTALVPSAEHGQRLASTPCPDRKFRDFPHAGDSRGMEPLRAPRRL